VSGGIAGTLLDPVADTALPVAMYVTLAVVMVLPDGLAILAMPRDRAWSVMAIAVGTHTPYAWKTVRAR